MTSARISSLAALCLTLPACGGGDGGGSVASTPAPLQATAAASPAAPTRTPLPPTPATTTGSYSGISSYMSFSYDDNGVQQVVAQQQMAPDGSVSLGVNASTRTYTLTAKVGPFDFPTGQMTIPADSDLGYTRNGPIRSGSGPEFFSPEAQKARGDLVTQAVAAGTGANGATRAQISFVRLYNVGQMNGGPRYLSTAQWGQFYSENPTGVPSPENFKIKQQTVGTMVFGMRTEPGDMPLSGQARYRLESLSGGFLGPEDMDDPYSYNPDGNTVLDVDFASRNLRATYDLANKADLYRYDDEGNILTDDDGNALLDGTVTTSIHASGSTTIANSGLFSVALVGTGSVHTVLTDKPAVPGVSTPVTGSLDGAFFGPQAAEVGGIWNLPVIVDQQGSVGVLTGDFAGLKE